ncbi:general transcription and DNA repair factor IIH subunit Tfb2p [Diutina catenulata]
MSSNLFKATVNEYLEELPRPIQLQLFESAATCLAIFRLLPPMAKFFVMSMVFNSKSVSLKDLDKWCKPSARKQQIEALKRLRSLHIIEEDGPLLHLQPTFRAQFRDCLTGNQPPNAFGSVHLDNSGDSHVHVKFLDKFASSKWETILHYMVGTQQTATPSSSVLALLKKGGLMEGPHHSLRITNHGFQFLLQDSNAQIWTLLLQYLNLTQELNMDPVDVLNFIFILGSLELGKSYTLSSLSETQVKMLADLKDYGLVYRKSERSSEFYPTRLATTLTSESAGLKTPAMALDQANESSETETVSNSESIILETNFKLYAYTNSPLEIAILNLFVTLKTRFANMVCGQITRESIREALTNGITAEQIIKFLETHAHPQMRLLAKEKLDKKIEFDTSHNINTAGGAPSTQGGDKQAQHKLEILPPTVVDQIKLWQLELDRIQTFQGYLFKDFPSQHEYDVLCNYAQEIGVLIWSNKATKRLFVTNDGLNQVADYANRHFRRRN